MFPLTRKMTRPGPLKTRPTFVVCVCVYLLGLIHLPGGPARAGQEPDEALLQMVVQLLRDADRDMRALGLQQVREEAPGQAATQRFVALLPQLPPDGQAELLEALGERGDRVARPAVLKMLTSQKQRVRVAALRALGGLGSAPDVPLLAQRTAAGTDAERGAARQSLVRLRGEGVNRAIVAAMADSEVPVQVQLLKLLAARNAKEALPTVLENAARPERPVRLAALDALRRLADPQHTAAIVRLVAAAKDPTERSRAEFALLAVCSRGRQQCARAIIAGLNHADGPSAVVLLHGLARAGGADSLDAVVACLKHEDEAVRDEAVRMLSRWPSRAAAPHLLAIAQAADSLRRQVLAIRGLVRLGRPQPDRPADLAMLADAMRLAKRPQEKRLVWGALGGTASPQSLALALSALDKREVADEAALAVLLIAEKIGRKNREAVRAAIEKVLDHASSRQLRRRAQKILESL